MSAVTRVATRWWWVAALILAFLVSRLVFLDRDLPPWDLTNYQPIDEFAYVLPAFNLHHYGTWSHQEVPWAPIEGWPMTVIQSLVTAGTLALDWSYAGFRLPSVLFSLVAFLAMVAVARRLARLAEADRVATPIPPKAMLAVTVVVLLVDLGFLVAGRVVEPTISRVAMLAVLLWLVDRGTFLGASHNGRRSYLFGGLACLFVGFGYVYNAFFIPGAIALAAWWGWRRAGIRAAVRHAAIAGVGAATAFVAYFGWVYAEYGDTPVEWYRRWVAGYRDSGRADAIDLGQLWDLLVGNTLRLDRPLTAICLIVLPVFIWWARRNGDRLGIAVIAFGAAFVAQTALQSDYGPRKMLILLPLIVPMALGGMLRVGEWIQWTAAEGRRPLRIAWIVWVGAVGVLAVALALPAGSPVWRLVRHLSAQAPVLELAYRGAGSSAVLVGAAIGVGALLVLIASWHRPRLAVASGAVLTVAMLGPLLLFDARHVFTNVTTAYRDAMIDVAPLVDDQVTAGDLSYAMQLYNTSRPVLEGYVYGMTHDEYDQALVRFFKEGRACCLFGYADGGAAARLQRLGFRLVETYPIVLPKGHVLGRYEYRPDAPAP